jgi:DNA-binding IclR family transcriptional regulator
VANAVDRVSSIIQAIAAAGETTAVELAAELKMSRQAIARLTDALVSSGLVTRSADSKRLSLSLRFHSWGSLAVRSYLPAATTQLEMARLAAETRHPVFYAVRQDSWTYTMERTMAIGDRILTKAVPGANPWSQTTTGRVLVAFAPPAERARLLAGEQYVNPGFRELASELEEIHEVGFSETHTTDVRYTLAAPLLDESGYALATLAIIVAKYDPSERQRLIESLLETAARCATHMDLDILSSLA